MYASMIEHSIFSVMAGLVVEILFMLSVFSILSVMAGWIAEMLFMLFFACIAV